MSQTPLERIRGKYKTADSGCWEWQAGLRRGYGAFWISGSTRAAHRVMWELYHNRPADKHKVIDHTCMNTLCVNPDHLEEVTVLENTQRYHRTLDKSHCKNGHKQVITRLSLRREGGRAYKRCLDCHIKHQRRYLFNKRERGPHYVAN